ncbi:Protein of unknown function [Amycolatopsis arida]|uniref:DUF3040 domain-containing protein n=1 Tax=Amycolatopsis arida TaxID=587909 RepID=A0A1I5ZBN8_9PSEU|nr:DUF3040 domain-containing protein [Amycolatopsis arida]TDX89490.1 Protein of unknown function (DUF3040) [Amycolatopsis arida]SFQ53798.1 Protein of unknown function [Amycolatopsis arida]
MLSESERRSLAEIEQWIRAEDPELDRRFTEQLGRRRWPYGSALVGAALLLLTGLVLGIPLMSLAGFVLTAASGAALWLTQHVDAPDDDTL